MCSNSTSSEFSQQIHFESPGHKHIYLEELNILDREPSWSEKDLEEGSQRGHLHLYVNTTAVLKLKFSIETEMYSQKTV